MKQSAAAVGGEFDINSDAHGCVATLTLPLLNPAPPDSKEIVA